MTTRSAQRRKQRRRQHVETARRSDAPTVDRDGAPRADLLESRHATVRLAVAVACLIGAQFLHWSVIDQHAQEWSTAGVFFFVLALVEGLMTVLVIARLQPVIAAAGIAVSVVPVVVWAWDRTLGLPFGPTKGVRGTIGRSDVLSVVFEVLTVAALWPFLRPRYGVRRSASDLDLISKTVIGLTVVYVVGFSYWAMLGDQGTIHGATATTVTGAGQPGLPTTVASPTTALPPGVVPTQTLSYEGKEFTFAGPSTAVAGVTRFILQNLGLEAHDMQIARIPESSPTPSTRANLESMFAEAQRGSAGAPAIIADTLSTDAGSTSNVVVDLTPGRYILSCANASSDGSYHYAQGMITVLTVTDPASG